jgi:predicted N-acetyltransferase YhbS
MRETFRHYHDPEDFELVGDFLVETFRPGNESGNWLRPAWEYMHSHPYLDKSSLGRIGIWEELGKIVAVAHYESRLGEGFFQIRPDYGHLKLAMLEYAEANLGGEQTNGARFIQAYVNDFDSEFLALVQSRGYKKDEASDRPLSRLRIARPFLTIELPEGFHLKSLAEDNDLEKVHRVLWRGFNHPGEPPADGLVERANIQLAPNYRKDLTIVVAAPGGDFVSFCGMWYEHANRIAYVEPVATDPDFRRMGLGKAAVLEGIRRCGVLGAEIAYVGSDQPFYQALGFQKTFTSQCWVKHFSA